MVTLDAFSYIYIPFLINHAENYAQLK